MNAQSPVESHSRPNVSTLQSSVFIRGDLKSRCGFLYTRVMTSFANKVEILIYVIILNNETEFITEILEEMETWIFQNLEHRTVKLKIIQI